MTFPRKLTVRSLLAGCSSPMLLLGGLERTMPKWFKGPQPIEPSPATNIKSPYRRSRVLGKSIVALRDDIMNYVSASYV